MTNRVGHKSKGGGNKQPHHKADAVLENDKPEAKRGKSGVIKPVAIKEKSQFVRDLAYWYNHYKRDLPWRRKPSLYKTLLSEFMLQQTQVVTVLPYFEKWLTIFPHFTSLAQADESLVVKHWEGLGYYSRARNLHKLAQAYVAASPKPKSAQAWLSFPGVGPYTAAAIASITFSEKVAVVDGNVIRILTRLIADDTLYKDGSAAVKTLTPLANAIVQQSENPGNHNQAMMELGATLCTKANPQCLLCPVRMHCAGSKTGRPEDFPQLAKRKTIKRNVHRTWILDGKKKKLLLYRRPAHAKRLANICELPECSQLELKPDNSKLLFKKKRGISNERINEHIYQFSLKKSLETMIQENDELLWAELSQLDHYTLSGPHKKWIKAQLTLSK